MVLLAGRSGAQRTPTPEDRCNAGRWTAAGTYAACEQRAKATGDLTHDFVGQRTAMLKCGRRYAAAWRKLETKARGTGVVCDNPRFMDNGDGTVTDRLTGLQWEKKVNADGLDNPADPHDADNLGYSWSSGGGAFTAADGTAFTDFLTTLNGAGCFAGQCDWRLPTWAELQTILTRHRGCTPGPCVGPADPALGPAVGGWSATTDPLHPGRAWSVSTVDGTVFSGSKRFFNGLRAVRGGL